MLVAELLQIHRSVCLEPEWELAGKRRTKNNWLHVRKLRGSSNTVEDTCNEEEAKGRNTCASVGIKPTMHLLEIGEDTSEGD